MLSIGNFSKIANVSTKTLRYYDEIGILKPSYVDNNSGYRYYEISQLQTLLLINRLKRYDFALDEIALVIPHAKDCDFLLSLIKKKQKKLEKKIDLYAISLDQLKEDIVNLEGGRHIMSYLDKIEVKLTQTQAMNVVSIREKINITKYADYMNTLYKKVMQESLTPVGGPLSIHHGEEFNPESYDMEIAIPIKEAEKRTREFPAYLCAHVTHKGDYSGLSSAYTKIREWVEKEGYKLVAAPFEVYTTDPSKTAPEENITEIYFPVEK